MTISDFNVAISRIKEKIPLSKIVSKDIALQKKGTEFVGNCPFHFEKTGSFFVNDNKGTFYCFGCGASGDIFEYLMKKQGLQFIQAVEKLAEMAGVKLPEKHAENADFINKKLKLQQKALDFFKQSLKSSPEALAYCKEREIGSDLIEKFSIGYAPYNSEPLLEYLKDGFSINEILSSDLLVKKEGKLAARFRNRLIFPVFNKSGWPIAFGGRAIKKDAIPKYLNSSESELFQKREVLYAYNLALKNVNKDVPFIIVEGYMDVVKMHKYGFNTSIASMGTALSSEHLAKIWKYSDEPIMCLDGDGAGYKAMVRVALLSLKYLEPGKSLRFCKLPEGDDPDSFFKKHGISEMTKLLSGAAYLVDFLWEYFLADYNSMDKKTPERIAKWKKEIFQHIKEIQNIDVKNLYQKDTTERIAKLLKNKAAISSSESGLKQINKKEKILLREASLLYIIMMSPSIISDIIEELAAMEFLDEDFKELQSYIINCFGESDFSFLNFNNTIEKIKKIVGTSFEHSDMSEDFALSNWKSIFAGINKSLHKNELKIAKTECAEDMNITNWNRLKALKLDFISKKK